MSASMLTFESANALPSIDDLSDAQLDDLDFGVIGFDSDDVVQRYNRFECQSAGLSPGIVLEQPLFIVVAPCLNNYLVAQRFLDAAAEGLPLDCTLQYVLTHRMRATNVKLRLLAAPTRSMRYVLVQRRP